MSRFGRLTAVSLAGSLAVFSAQAQALRPPLGMAGDAQVEFAQGQDAAGLMVRIDRLEGQLRSQTGQIEQMQFQIKRLEDQLKKFQQDVDFRFQENAGRGGAPKPATPALPPGHRTELNENGYPVVGQGGGALPPAEAMPARTASAARAGRRGDAFDPDSDPVAPGAPRQLGETPFPSAPARVATRAPASSRISGPLDDGLDADPDAPLDLMRGAAAPPRAPAQPAASPIVIAAPRIVGEPQLAPAEAPRALTPRDEFDAAMALLRGGQFDAAGESFNAFIQKHPKDRLAADATFYLGESYYKRSRPREAAEQYLKVSTNYEKSARAPEALLKLGLSLEKLGAREQACAAYGEVGRKYPTTTASIRSSAEKESKRAQC